MPADMQLNPRVLEPSSLACSVVLDDVATASLTLLSYLWLDVRQQVMALGWMDFGPCLESLLRS
jgi:hypothetical protein